MNIHQMNNENYRYQILIKEMDLIQSNIHNLDSIIYRMKNFAVILWGGALYLIAEHLGEPERSLSVDKIKLYLAFTSIIPLIFWIIHTRWQKHISMSSQREKILSYFINSPRFEAWLTGDSTVHFPLYDICGWYYTKKEIPKKKAQEEDIVIPTWEKYGFKVDPAYLLDHDNATFWRLLWYKDAAWYYPIMLLISLGFAIVY